MTTECWKLEKDLCRCCHSEGYFQNLSENTDSNVIYSKMLKDAFNIDMEPLLGELSNVTYTICKTCILRLNEATIFKNQVVACEERLKEIYCKNLIEVYNPNLQNDVAVKLEKSDDDLLRPYSPIRDDDDYAYEDDYVPDDDKKEDMYLEEVKTKKTASKKRTIKSKKKRKAGRPKKYSDDGTINNGNEDSRDKWNPTKFSLREEDYRKEGDLYHCTRCEKKYDKIYSLRFHVKVKHYKIPRYFCPLCSKEFMTAAPLTVHKLKDHDIDERFKCNACKGTFNTKVQLRKHINNFHMLGEKLKCDFCDYESFSFEGMYKHKFKHKTVKDYHCKFCRKSFLRKTTLDLHERIHTGDRRKVCKVCGQAFVQKASLNYHMTKYHPGVTF